MATLLPKDSSTHDSLISTTDTRYLFYLDEFAAEGCCGIADYYFGIPWLGGLAPNEL